MTRRFCTEESPFAAVFRKGGGMSLTWRAPLSYLVIGACAGVCAMGALAGRARDSGELRSIIREELRNAPPAAAAPPSPSAVVASLIGELSPEQLVTCDRARDVVRGGIARGAWTAADRGRLRDVAGDLPPPVVMEMVRPLVVAVNHGRVRSEFHERLW
jgi:hypothetical protein